MSTEDPSIFNNDQYLMPEIIINEVYTRFVKSTYYNSKNSITDMLQTKPKFSIAKMNTEDFLKKLNPSSGLEILPKNCRMKKITNGYTIFVIEDPPMLRTIKVNLRLDSEVESLKMAGNLEKFGYKDFLNLQPEPPYKFQLSFPYIVYILIYENTSQSFIKLNLFYRLHPLSSTSDFLLESNLLNIGETGSVCLGDRDKLDATMNMNEHAEKIIDTFWGNEFNNDIITQYKLYSTQPEIATFLSWKHYTKVDPMFIFDLKWKQYSLNLSTFIEQLVGSTKSNDREIDMFNRVISQDVNANGNAEVCRTQSLNAIPLFDSGSKGNRYLEVGAEIELDEKKYFVYGIKFKGNKVWAHLEDEDGVISEHVANDKFSEKVRDYYNKKKSIKSIEIGGIMLKTGLVLESVDGQGRKKLKEIDEIIRTRDGKIEARSGNQMFIITENQLIGAKIFDKNNVCFKNGIKAAVGNNYVFIKDDHYPMYPVNCVKLKELKVSGDALYYVFIPIAGTKDYSYTDSNFNDIIEYNEKQLNRSALPVFRIGNVLLNNAPESFYKFHLFDDGFGVTPNGTNKTMIMNDIDYYDIQKIKVDVALIKREIFKDNKLLIKSFDMDIEFNIGDDVVIADYLKPLSYVTKVRKINGFIDDGKIFYIQTIAEDGEKLEVPYIDFTSSIEKSGSSNIMNRVPKINVGLVRKIITEAGEFKKGMKVRAKIAGIPAFPKKDTNEIIGIIIDSGYKPMIFCTNGHTIWCDEKSKELFQFVSSDSKAAKLMETSKFENVTIKWQPGDIVKNPDADNDYLCRWDLSGARKVFSDDGILNQKSFGSYDRKLGVNSTYRTIPIPRFNSKSVVKIGVSMIPNYHGWYTFKKNSKFKINVEEI